MRTVGPLLLSLALLCTAPQAIAQDEEGKLDERVDIEALQTKMANTRWSMIFPEMDYEGGCLMGYFTFRFSPTGYFTFDNRLQGSWRIDPAGNIQLKSRKGERHLLRLRGDNEVELLDGLRMSDADKTWRVRKNARFQKCANE